MNADARAWLKREAAHDTTEGDCAQSVLDSEKRLKAEVKRLRLALTRVHLEAIGPPLQQFPRDLGMVVLSMNAFAVATLGRAAPRPAKRGKRHAN